MTERTRYSGTGVWRAWVWCLLSVGAAAAAQAQTSTTEGEPSPDGGSDVTDAADAASADTDATGREAAASCLEGGACQIEDLKTPASPAFALIGVTPEGVVRPSTPRELAVAVYNGFGGDDVPTGFALEAAPYWLFPHPELTYADYRGAGLGAQVLHNLGISLASAEGQPDTNGDPTVEVGIGVRTNVVIYSFHRGQQIIDERTAEAEKRLLALQKIRLLERMIEANRCSEHGFESAPCKQAQAELARHRNDLESSNRALALAAEELQAALMARDGVSIELASALAFRSPTDELSVKDFARGAAWLTAGYTGESWNLLALGRYLRTDDPTAHFADAGVRAGAIWDRYGFHLEFMRRFVMDSPDGLDIDDSNRIAGTVEVRIADDLYVSATLGEEAASGTEEGGVIALAGVSFQAGRERYVSPQR